MYREREGRKVVSYVTTYVKYCIKKKYIVLLNFLEEIRTVTMGQQPMHFPYPNYNLLLQIFCWRSKNAALLGGRDENRIT